MANVHDVAAYMIERTGPITAGKLQKLLYYTQAWHLVWKGAPMFANEIEAWANGPVIADIHRAGRQGKVGVWAIGAAVRLKAKEKTTVETVVRHYGKWSSQELTELIRSEPPWRDARGDLPPDREGGKPIPQSALLEHYSSVHRDEPG